MNRSPEAVFDRFGVVRGVVLEEEVEEELAALLASRALRFQRGIGALQTGAVKLSMSEEEFSEIFVVRADRLLLAMW